MALCIAMPLAASSRFERYGVEDGLSQTTVRTLLQDRRGYLWLGTQDGLNRFDGYEFRVHRHDVDDRQSICDNHILSLASSKEGFWVGTQSGGFAHYREMSEDFQCHRVADGQGQRSDNISALLEDDAGVLWIGTAEGFVQRLDRRSGRFTDVAGIDATKAGRIRFLQPWRDQILVGTRVGITAVGADGRSRPWPNADFQAEVEALVVDPRQDDVWVGTTTGGVLRFDAKGRVLRAYQRADGLSDDNVRGLLRDRRGHIWVATLDGLNRIDPASDTVRHWRFGQGMQGSLASSRVQALVEDRDGLIWIGTWLNGVNLFNPKTETFQEVQPLTGLPLVGLRSAIPGVMVDADGSLWLGILEGGGLAHYDLQKGLIRRYVHDPALPDSLPSPVIQHIARDRQGRLWLATGNGLARLRADGNGFEVFRYDRDDPTSLPYDSLQRLLVDHRGTLWIGTSGGGLASRCENCTVFQRHPPLDPDKPGNASSEVINAIFEDSRKQLWIGLRPGGLVRYDPVNGQRQIFRGEPGKAGALSHNTVTVITEDASGHLWVGTQGGGVNRMYRNDEGEVRFQHFNRRNGLGADAVGGILQDASGAMWVSTTAGISRIDPKSGRVESYGARDGAQPTGYFVGAYAHLGDERMVFGGLSGLTVFSPGASLARTPPNRVELTGIRVNGRPWPAATSPHSFAADAATVTFEFSALSFSDPQSLRYSYRMQGLDDEWTETDATRRYATFRDVTPGTYLLEVRASAADGAWGPTLSLPVTWDAPWWSSTWARLLWFALAVLAVLAIWLWTRRREQERQAVGKRIQDSESRLKLALWGSGDELWDWNIPGNEIRRMNPVRYLDASDYLVTDALAIRRSILPQDLPDYDSSIQRCLRGQVAFWDHTARVISRDSEERWMRIRGKVVERDADGRALRMTGTISDVTDVKRHEVELSRLNDQLESRVATRTEALAKANSQLEQSLSNLREAQKQLVESERLASLGGLVAGVAHEINTPLGVGVTAASHLEAAVSDLERKVREGRLSREEFDVFRDTARESADIILRNLRRADRLVRSFKQVAVDQASEQYREVGCRQYLEEILLSLQPALRKTAHRVQLLGEGEIPLATYPGALYQIVVNLVMNALVHGLREVEQGTVRIHYALHGDSLRLSVSDDGCGIAAEVLPKIFDPFFTTQRGSGGSGLGLHIAWTLATQILRGTLRCESAPAKGATFILEFPARLPPPSAG